MNDNLRLLLIIILIVVVVFLMIGVCLNALDCARYMNLPVTDVPARCLIR